MDYKTVNKNGLTILHYVVEFGDVKTAQILTRAKLGGIDIEAKDKNGKKAIDYLDTLPGKPEGFDEAIKQLIESIQEANENDQDQFIDAVEVQEASVPNY